MFLIPGGTLQYLTKWKQTALGFIQGAHWLTVGLILVFSRANGKPQRPIRVKKEICCLDTAEFIDRVFSLRGMNKEESKILLLLLLLLLHCTWSSSWLKFYIGLLFGYFPAVEGLLAAELGIIWKEHHGGPFEIRQCSRMLSNVAFLELHVRHFEFEQESADGRAIETSHLLSKQPGARLNTGPILYCLRYIHEVDEDIFGFMLNPRHVEIMEHFQCSFREVMKVFVLTKTPKAHNMQQ